jgi:penicillin-binding protein 1A
MSLRTALAKSKNMVSIRVLQAVGAKQAQQWITQFGFEADKHPAFLTMALGAGSVTPMQMAEGYTVFANGGYRVPGTLIQSIRDDKGRLLFEMKGNPPREEQRVIEARNAFVMSSLLQEVTRSGTAARAQATLKRNDLFGKTGTTNDSLDAWFAGYQPGLVAVVWVGYDQPRKLGSRETGGGLALPIWIDFMQFALRDTPVATLEPPEGLLPLGGDWVYDEFVGERGVDALTQDAPTTPPAASPDEKKSILDLFKN